jgi:EAL domain-containing protein (putative c-di-GMP-specific phosphodiesterase class I)
MEPGQSDSARQALAVALEQGIERENLFALYQPVVSFTSGRPSHLEALVRWNRPGVQLLTPDKFIRIAEQTNVIDKLGAWMLNRAVNDCVAWQESAPGIGVSINVSPRQFDREGFVDLIDSVVCDAGLASELLTIEISERSINEWRHPMLGALREIRALGVKVSLDDVGTSDISLRVLSALPLNELKIDTSLVASLAEEGVDSRLIRLIIEVAKSLGVTAVAEGIDSAIKLRALQQLGCRYGQGLLFAEPARFSMVVRELASERSTTSNSAPS